MAAIQPERSEVPAPHRSIIPSVPGVPAGAAVLIAVACTSIGFFIDASGGKELTNVFAAFYIVGCALAALAVRYRGLFTTMVMPPPLLFLAVPVAYGQLVGHSSTSLKDILLNQGLPLVNRFPTMAVATVLVLAIGGGRMMLQRRPSTPAPRSRRDRPRKGNSSGPRPDSERSRRSRSSDSSDTLRRRARTQSPATNEAAAKPSRTSRKTTGRVAERPPRVSAAQGSRTSERTAVPTRQRAETGAQPRQRSGDAQRSAVDAQPRQRSAGDPQPRQRAADAQRQRGAADPQARQRAAAPVPRQRVAADPQPRHGRADNADVPPHPRPNVRYRERDSGRIEH